MADGLKLLRLLKRAHLGGIIEEAVVDLDAYSIQAVDITNSLFLKVAEESDVEDIGEIGIGNLALVCKYLDTFKGEVSISKDGNRLIIGSKGRGKLKYLTTDPEFIPTAVKEGDIDSLLAPCVISVALDKAACADVATYFGLIKPKSANFSFDPKTKEVRLDSGLKSDHQFTLPIGKGKIVDGKKANEAFGVEVYSEHINAVFAVLEWPDKHKPSLFMKAEHPIVIQQDDDNIWALLPLEPTAEEDKKE
jgi:hypothetical protein